MSKSILIAVFALIMLFGLQLPTATQATTSLDSAPIDTTESRRDNCGRVWSWCH